MRQAVRGLHYWLRRGRPRCAVPKPSNPIAEARSKCLPACTDCCRHGGMLRLLGGAESTIRLPELRHPDATRSRFWRLALFAGPTKVTPGYSPSLTMPWLTERRQKCTASGSRRQRSGTSVRTYILCTDGRRSLAGWLAGY